MISGIHVLLYSANAEADRAFIRDRLGFPHVDIGHGWLIFALPPAEAAVHPGDGRFAQAHADTMMLGALLYLMCDDLPAEIAALAAKGVTCGPVQEQDWGRATSVPLPSGGSLGLYEPAHRTALGMWRQPSP
jgi:hypothetical protein